MKKFYFIFIFSLLLIGGCPEPEPETVLATFGSQKITVGDLKTNLQREVSSYPVDLRKNPKSLEVLKERTLNEMVDRRLLLAEAIKNGTDVSSQELLKEVQRHKSQYTEINFQKMLQAAGISTKDWVERKRENLIIKKYLDHFTASQRPITPEQIREYYQKNTEAFAQPEAVRVRQIVTDSKEKAESIMRRLRNGENFAKLARDLSLSPDRKQGGDLGFIVKGSFPREFEVCFQMNPGEVSPIIPSAYGFHLFKILEKRPAKTLPLKEVEGKIVMQLKLQAREDSREELLKQLKEQHPVIIEEKVLTRVRL